MVSDAALGPFPAQVFVDIGDPAPRDAPHWVKWGPMDELKPKSFRSALGCPKPKGGKGRGKGRNKAPPKAPPKSGKPPPKSEQLKSEVPGSLPKPGVPVVVDAGGFITRAYARVWGTAE